ncbi:MAG: hypothetical protein K6F02_09185, partial [Prevotella sp.]|nr:hypothetical protein [Prevotella sp.]
KIISFNKIISNTTIYPTIIPADSEKNVVPIVPFVTTGTSSPTKRNFLAKKVTFETKNGEMGRLRWKSGS